jgi:putative transposase
MTEMIEPMPAAIDQEQLARDLVERARAEGVELLGPGGLLSGLTKTVLTEIGPVQIEVPRERDASFGPRVVRKRQRRLDGIDQIMLSLTARWADHRRDRRALRRGVRRAGQQGHHLPDHRQGDRGDDEWRNRPVYVVIGVNGERDILGLWAGDGGDGAKLIGHSRGWLSGCCQAGQVDTGLP